MKKILIVEPDEVIRALLVEILNLQKEKYLVKSVSDGYLALETLENTSVDLVLTDYRMPGMNGMEAFVKMRKIYPHLPVIMMSGYAGKKLYRTFFQAGGTSFIKKPFGLNELLVKVETVLVGR